MAGACLVYASAAGLPMGFAIAVLCRRRPRALRSPRCSRRRAAGASASSSPTRCARHLQGVFSMGYSLGAMVAPLFVTSTALTFGLGGWAILAAVFLAYGLGTWHRQGCSTFDRTRATRVPRDRWPRLSSPHERRAVDRLVPRRPARRRSPGALTAAVERGAAASCCCVRARRGVPRHPPARRRGEVVAARLAHRARRWELDELGGRLVLRRGRPVASSARSSRRPAQARCSEPPLRRPRAETSTPS
jgi:hypothetical protein